MSTTRRRSYTERRLRPKTDLNLTATQTPETRLGVVETRIDDTLLRFDQLDRRLTRFIDSNSEESRDFSEWQSSIKSQLVGYRMLGTGAALALSLAGTYIWRDVQEKYDSLARIAHELEESKRSLSLAEQRIEDLESEVARLNVKPEPSRSTRTRRKRRK